MTEVSSNTLFTYTAILFVALLTKDLYLRDFGVSKLAKDEEPETESNPPFYSKFQGAPVVSFSIWLVFSLF